MILYNDSQLEGNQINNDYEAKKKQLINYLMLARKLMSWLYLYEQDFSRKNYCGSLRSLTFMCGYSIPACMDGQDLLIFYGGFDK